MYAAEILVLSSRDRPKTIHNMGKTLKSIFRLAESVMFHDGMV